MCCPLSLRVSVSLCLSCVSFAFVFIYRLVTGVMNAPFCIKTKRPAFSESLFVSLYA